MLDELAAGGERDERLHDGERARQEQWADPAEAPRRLPQRDDEHESREAAVPARPEDEAAPAKPHGRKPRRLRHA